jgi:hypothetical protein
MRLLSAMIAVTLSCVVPAAGPASAQSFTFISSTHATCWEDTEGFDASLQPKPVPNPPPAGTHFLRFTDAVTTGTSTFNVDGSFTAQDQTSSIRSSGNALFGHSHSTCNGTFTFNASDQTLHTSSSCTFQDTIPNADTGTVTGIQGVLQLTPNQQLVHSGPNPPVVETVSVNVASGGSFTFFRVCTRAGAQDFLR